MKSFKVLKLRKRIGWSQAEMARAIGSSRLIISHWETGVKEPKRIASRFLSLLYSLSDSELKHISMQLESLSKEQSND